ncbi:MAG: S8 family serine peptidase [Acidobacteriota bacterium]|nr:S8 family serine peptidase [Acidobacteriota bacterium]
MKQYLILALLFIAPAIRAQQPVIHTDTELLDVVPGQFFVRYYSNSQRKHPPSLRTLSEYPELAAELVTADSRDIGLLMADPAVRYIEPVPRRYAASLKKAQLQPNQNNGLYGLVVTKVTEVHARGIDGTGIKIGVADTGIDYRHPDIAPNYRGGIDTISGDSDPWWNEDPQETHGTHVAGTIIAAHNELGVLGIAYKAELYHARVLGPRGGSSASVIDGVRWLVEQAGCRIINLSLGGGRKSKTEEDFYNLMHSKGVLVIAAAGNEAKDKLSFPARYVVNIAVGAVDRNQVLASFSNTGKNIDVVAPGVSVLSTVPQNTSNEAFVEADSTISANPLMFAGLTSDNGITGTLVDCKIGKPNEFPQSIAGQIALIERGELSFREKVDNAMKAGAAGVIIYNNTVGNFVGTLGSPTADGGRSWIPAISVSNFDGEKLKASLNKRVTLFNQLSSWDTASGTSMATPHVTGIVALIWAANPALTNTQVEEILKSTAKDLGNPGYDKSFGFGLVDASAAVSKAGK